MRFSKGLLAVAFLISALPMFGAAYIKFDGVDGESKAAGHEKWIELNSVQFEGGSCAFVGRTLRLRIASTNHAVPASINEACRSQTPYRNVIVEEDGQRHVLRNVKFSACPTSAEVPVQLQYESCETHPTPGKVEIGALKGGSSESAARRSPTTLEGLTRQPLELVIRRATINGNTATIALVGGSYSPTLGQAIVEATAKGKTFDPMILKAAGQQWTFSKAMFTSASFSPGQDAIFSFQFQAMNGSLPAFQALGGN
ncbi:MAG: hypothetical protein ABI779_00275 [Acidobacteriota bacterium]